jgi:LysM domain
MTETPPIESPYVTVGGDSLPSIAERLGHAGEWQAIAEANTDHIWADYNNLQPGLEIELPAEWLTTTEPVQAETLDAAELAGLNAADLVDLANAANTLAELDAIEAAANGRVTVLNAVSARRTALLDAGVAT